MAMVNDRTGFVGTWMLVEWNIQHAESGVSRQAYGGNAQGHIIYTADGWVSATLMEVGRAPVSSDRIAIMKLKHALADSPDKALDQGQLSLLTQFYQAASGYVAYCGTFRVTDSEVHHDIAEALLPQMVGTTLTRSYDFNGDTLTLVANREEYQDELVWKRVSP